MARWRKEYLGLTECPKDLTQAELDVFFSFSADELAAIRTRYKSDLRIGAALQLGFLKLAGCTMSTLNVVPRKLLAHIGEKIGEAAPTIATLRALYKRRRRTLFNHQSWAIELLGFGELSDYQERMLTARLREEARTATSVDLMMDYARSWLFDRKLLIPSSRRLRDLSRRALFDVEADLHASVIDAIPASVRESWLRELSSEPKRGGRATVEWLHQGPRRGPRKGLEAHLEKIDYLREIKVDQYPLEEITLEKQRFYARRMRRRRPSRLQELSEPRRTLEVVCFLRVALMQANDTALHMTRQRTANIMREADKETSREEAKSALTYREAIRQISELVADDAAEPAEVRNKIKDVLAQLKPKVHKSRAAAMREKLMEKGGPIRALLHAVVKMPIQGEASEPVAQAIEVLREVYKDKGTVLPPDADVDVRPMWRKQVDDEDRGKALRALEASTLIGLHRGLRRGSIWSNDSIEFRNMDVILIASKRWKKDRKRLYQRLGVPETADAFYEPILANLQAGLEAVAATVECGALRIEGDAFGLPPIAPEALPKTLASVRDAVMAEIGEVQLPELLLEIDSQVHFSRHLLGRSPESERELLPIYGGILGHATEMDATGVALMTPGLAVSQILGAMRMLEDERTFRRANDEVMEFIRRHPVAKYWGNATTAASDMMSLDVSRHLWRARIDPRRKAPAVGVYQHVLDQWAISWDLPLVLMDRQAGAAIEGVIRQSLVDVERLSVDTHGYTDFAMAQAKILGFDLCPRLKNLRERRLHVPPGVEVPAVLEPVVERDVSLKAIGKGWDELVRIAASIEDGTASADLALQRFGSAAKGDPTHTAGTQLGRLLRTVFLCDYYSKPTFRRELHRVLNHGESVHALERAIFTGKVAPARGRRPDELVALSGALTLLTNITMAWTTSRLQAVADKWGREQPGRLTPELLAHIAPVAYANINFRGTFRFPFERY